jgi:hypothetical protein
VPIGMAKLLLLISSITSILHHAGENFWGRGETTAAPFGTSWGGCSAGHAAAQWPRRRFLVCRAARAAPYSASTHDRNPGGEVATRAVERKECTEHAVLKVMHMEGAMCAWACNGLLVSAHDRRPRHSLDPSYHTITRLPTATTHTMPWMRARLTCVCSVHCGAVCVRVRWVWVRFCL